MCRTSSVLVNVGGISTAASISVGGFHGCAVLASGANVALPCSLQYVLLLNRRVLAWIAAGGLRCWGYNIHGQLGDGTGTIRCVAVTPTGLSSGVVSVAASQRHTCALLGTGAVKCFGWNDEGQLGNGGTTLSLSPVTALMSAAVQLSAGALHTCARNSSGAYCWGYNAAGQLGDGTSTSSLVPVAVSVSSVSAVPVVHIVAGGWGMFMPLGSLGCTCGLLADGNATCFGDRFVTYIDVPVFFRRLFDVPPVFPYTRALQWVWATR